MTAHDAVALAGAYWKRLTAIAGGVTTILVAVAYISGAWSYAGLPEAASRAHVEKRIADEIKPIKEQIGALTSTVTRVEEAVRKGQRSSLRIEQLGLEARIREIDRIPSPDSGLLADRLRLQLRLYAIEDELEPGRPGGRGPR